jgi:hypothetical protein
MKVTLPERSLTIKPLLDQVSSEILAACGEAVAKLLL